MLDNAKVIWFQSAAEDLLASLERERDVDVIIKRFGLNLARRSTLDQIGRQYGITRERVRQIERAAIGKLRQTAAKEHRAVSLRLGKATAAEGGVALLDEIALKLGAETPKDKAYIYFLAALVDSAQLLDETKERRATLIAKSSEVFGKYGQLADQLIKVINKLGRPSKISEVAAAFKNKKAKPALIGIAKSDKRLASFDGLWGLATWPQVNPKGIRDRAYLALQKKGQPQHFSQIAKQIEKITPSGRKVTMQAVHNELIKDDRFVLIGRGIYALAEWGYTPGTVADMIVTILRDQQPLSRDEIVRRVLMRRQVKTATILLNLQDKQRFIRTPESAYKLRRV